MPPTPLWRDRNFLTLWAGQTVSAYGDQVAVVALPLLGGWLGTTLACLWLLLAPLWQLRALPAAHRPH